MAVHWPCSPTSTGTVGQRPGSDVKIPCARRTRPQRNLLTEATADAIIQGNCRLILARCHPPTTRQYLFHRVFARMLPGMQRWDVSASVVSATTPERVELAVKGRASDLQPPRDFRHLAAIMGDREANHLGLDLVERADLALARRAGQSAAAGRQPARCRLPCAPPARDGGAIGAASASLGRGRRRAAPAAGTASDRRPAPRSAGTRRPRPRRPRPAPRRGTPHSRAGARCPASDSRRAAPAPRR